MAIEVNGMKIVVTWRKAYNTNGDNQVLHSQILGSDNVKVSIIGSFDINAYLPYLIEEMTIVGDVLVLVLHGQ